MVSENLSNGTSGKRLSEHKQQKILRETEDPKGVFGNLSHPLPKMLNRLVME